MSPELALEDLSKTIADGNISIVAQPVGSYDGKKILKNEILVRIPNRDVEKTFKELENRPLLIQSLTRLVIAKSLDMLEEMKKVFGKNTIKFAINFDPVLISFWPDFAIELKRQLETHHLQSNTVEIEFTERGILDISPESLDAMREALNDQGISVAEDDFGDGTAIRRQEREALREIEVLKNVRFQSFKTSANHLLSGDLPDLREAIEYAKQNRMCLIIEQVRDHDVWRKVLKKLNEYGFPKDKIGIQGYALSQPLKPEELVAYYREQLNGNTVTANDDEGLPLAA